MWDDHDYGPNGSDARARGRKASRLTYQEYQCHYPLPAGTGNVAIYQSIIVGRVRFILSDLRSERQPGRTMLGSAQKAWLKQEFFDARDRQPLILWVSSVPWIDSRRTDSWAGFKDERREIADFLKDNRIRGVCILSGDAHMLAADDGRNADYARSGGMPIRVLQAAAIDSSGSIKGGPYSVQPVPGPSQYGHLEIEDTGSKIHVRFRGRRVDDRIEEPVSLRFTVGC